MKEAKPKPKILVVEDSQTIQQLFAEWLADEVQLLHAFTVKQARELFVTHRQEIALIAIDACVPMNAFGSQTPQAPTTLPFVQQLREKFAGRMVAISSDPTYRQWLAEAGCDHEVEKDKFPQFVLDLLRDGKL